MTKSEKDAMRSVELRMVGFLNGAREADRAIVNGFAMDMFHKGEIAAIESVQEWKD